MRPIARSQQKHGTRFNPPSESLMDGPAAVREIADDHRRLDLLLAEPCTCLFRERGIRACEEAICDRGEQCAVAARNKLHQYLYAATSHFRSEERLMEHAPAEHRERHLSEHRQLTMQVVATMTELASAPDGRGIDELIARLGHALRHHWSTTDVELQQCLVAAAGG